VFENVKARWGRTRRFRDELSIRAAFRSTSNATLREASRKLTATGPTVSKRLTCFRESYDKIAQYRPICTNLFFLPWADTKLSRRGLAIGRCGLRTNSTRPPCDKLTRRVKFRFSRRAKHLYESPHPVLLEGALAIVTERWGRSCGGRGGIVRGMGPAGRVNSVSGSGTCRRAVPERTAKACGPDA
jgi:hypothetical protein